MSTEEEDRADFDREVIEAARSYRLACLHESGKQIQRTRRNLFDAVALWEAEYGDVD